MNESGNGMADFGPGFKDDGKGNAECRKHGKSFLAGTVNEEDVGTVLCLGCVDPSELTRRGEAVLRQMRSRAAARRVVGRG